MRPCPFPKCRRGNCVAHFNDSTLHHSGEMNETKTFYAAQKKGWRDENPVAVRSAVLTLDRQTESQTGRASERERPIFRNEMSGIVAQKSERNVRRGNGRERARAGMADKLWPLLSYSFLSLVRPSVHPTNLTSDFREPAGSGGRFSSSHE